MPVESLEYGTGLPDKYAAVPVKVAALNKKLCHGQLRLFGESLHLVKRAVPCYRLVEVGLYVTVTCLRPVRPYAKGKQDFISRGKPESLIHHLPELILLLYQVVCRGDGNNRIRVLRHDSEDAVGNAWCSIAPERLGKHMVTRYAKLADNSLTAFLIGHNIDVLSRTDLAEPTVGHLYQGLSGAQDVKELFCLVLPAQWPEPASDTTGHDQQIAVFHLFHR